jgi:hypothetical protein
MIERVVAYEPQFDRNAYESIEQQDKERLDAYTRRQIETHLGERFNVLLSETRFDIKDGKIYGENTTEPFMQMLERGVSYRREFGNPVDFDREEAEVVGFGYVEDTLTKDDAEVGTMMLSVSPPGGDESIYKHNFYDVFTLREDEEGRYVEAIRYSSSLTNEEYEEKVKPFKVFETTPTDSEFLREPIVVDKDRFKSPDDLHAYLHKEHDFITKEEFDQVLQIVTPLITSYINTMSERPFDQNLQILTFNAILNKADIALALAKAKDNQDLASNYAKQSGLSVQSDLYRFGKQPVRVVSTGCGSSGGFTVSQNFNATASPFSVSEFGIKNSKEEWFSCPKCSYKANGPVGDTCPGCRLTKEDFIAEGGPACD